MLNLASMIANIKAGFTGKKLKVFCFQNKYVIRIVRKLISEGILRGIHLQIQSLFIYLKYDDNYIAVVSDIKIISSSGHRVYFTFKDVIHAYFNNKIFLLSTNKGLFFNYEIILNDLKLGGEVVLRVDFF